MRVLCVQTKRIQSESAVDYVEKLGQDIDALDFDLMVLPEKWLASSITTDDKVWKELISIFQDISLKHEAAVAPGSFSMIRGGNMYNSAPVITSGKLQGFQDKISLYKIENGRYSRGNEIKTFEFRDMRFSVPVCYDLDFPYFSKIAVKKGADFLVNPSLIVSEFADMWHIYVRGRSLENRLPVISVNSASEPFMGKSIVTRMRPEIGGILLETTVMDNGHFEIIETNSNELRGHVKSRISEDPGEYNLMMPE